MAEDAPQRVASVLRSGYVGQGVRVEEFESALQEIWCTPRKPLAVNSCTSAITLALHLVGAKPGTEVVSTPMTCAATNMPILHSGAKVVWADINPETGLIDIADVARKITKRTVAIVAVDWGGARCDYGWLKEFGVPVIQDAAHSFYPRGGGGDYVAWSFQAIKFLTTGDGGALLVPESEYERAKLLRWYGLDRESKADFRCSQDIVEGGYKFHMNDIAAAIGLANLRIVVRNLLSTLANAYFYDCHINGRRWVQRPRFDETTSFWLYTLRVGDRSAFISYMGEKGIVCSPVHRRNDEFTCFAEGRTDLPGVDAFSQCEVAIPVGWWVAEKQRQYVAEAVNEWNP